ncbi:hypothetical protein LguiA_015544 [Lonicera macranthoides]
MNKGACCCVMLINYYYFLSFGLSFSVYTLQKKASSKESPSPQASGMIQLWNIEENSPPRGNHHKIRTKLTPNKVQEEPKKGMHPEFYNDAKVYCSGKLVLTTSRTKNEYVVGVWSGNHPYYLGA